jgi:chemotaxis protein MotB
MRPTRAKPRRTAPWLITYADLMTLLVCFFVMIVSFSIPDAARMQVVAGSIREAFGAARARPFPGEAAERGAPPAVEAAGAAGDPARADPRRGVAEAADARRFQAAKERLERAILLRPVAKDVNDAITINLTQTGLQLLIVDAAARPMFAPGGVEPTPGAAALLEEAARALAPLPNRVFIEAHADASGKGAYSPFDLTAARANAARRVMEAAGLPAERIAGVAGKGDAFPLYPEDPIAAGNRRIEITLEPAAPLLPADSPL